MFGAEGVKNGVTINGGTLANGTPGLTTSIPNSKEATILLDFHQLGNSQNDRALVLVHEGVHAADDISGQRDRIAVKNSNYQGTLTENGHYLMERRAYNVQTRVGKELTHQ
jgi:hypothetical protein